jgi:hypothetical protein
MSIGAKDKKQRAQTTEQVLPLSAVIWATRSSTEVFGRAAAQRSRLLKFKEYRYRCERSRGSSGEPRQWLCSSWRAANASARPWCSHNSSSKTCFRVSNTLCTEKKKCKLCWFFGASFAQSAAHLTRNSGTGYAGFLKTSFAPSGAHLTRNSGTGYAGFLK